MTDPLFQVNPSHALDNRSLGNSGIYQKAVRSRVDLGERHIPVNTPLRLDETDPQKALPFANSVLGLLHSGPIHKSD